MFYEKTWYTLFTLALLCFLPSLASANSFENVDSRQNPSLIQGVDYDVETISINDVYEIDSITNHGENDLQIEPRMVLMPGPLWKTTNVQYVGTVIGKESIWDTEGKPGMTIGTTYSKSITATVSNTFGASYSALSANLNFTIGKNYGVSSTGSYQVPAKYNGKKVSKVVLKAYPKYEKYSMQVHKRNDIYFRYDYKGTAYAQKPSGISFDYIFYYQ